jgi:hypothetical protein
MCSAIDCPFDILARFVKYFNALINTMQETQDVPRCSLGDACSLGLASFCEQASDVPSRLELEFTKLSRLAREHERGWNRLAD